MPSRRSQKSAKQQLRSFAMPATLGQAWKFSSIGGLILVFGYFVVYRYSPIESLGSVSALASLVAVLALVLCGVLFVTWNYPAGLLWVLATSDAAPRLRHLFGQPDPSHHGPRRFELRRFWRPVVIGLSWVMLPWMAMFVMLAPATFGADGCLRWLAGGGLICAAAGGWALLLKGQGGWKECWAAGVLAFLAVVLLFGPLTTFLQFFTMGSFAREEDALRSQLVVAFVGLLLSAEVVSYGIWVLRERDSDDVQVTAHLAWTVGAFLLVMFGLGAGGGVVDGVMAATSVRVPHARLVLASEGCAALDSLGGTDAPAGSGQTSQSCTLRNVLVVSRIGEQWRLGCPGKDREGLVLSAKHVLAWAPGDDKHATDARIAQWCAVAGKPTPPAKG